MLTVIGSKETECVMAEEKFDSIRKCWHGNGPECAKCEALDIPEAEELEQMYEQKLAAAREREAGLLAWQTLVTEAIGDAFEIAEELNASVEFEGKAYTSQIVDLLRPWLDTSDGNRVTPPDALDELRRRERSIGAEEEAYEAQ